MIGRHVAPAGAPIRLRDLARWAGRWTDLPAAAGELRLAICSDLGRAHCSLVSTGRAGLSVLLASLRDQVSPERNEVVLPSYTCYSVAASAVRAGLRLRIVDVDPATLDFDQERLGNADFRRVVAIVSTGLYGLPGRMANIAALARDRTVFLVDDAAQTIGASFEGVPAGAWGDAGLLSFDKGKAVAAVDGGALVADSPDLAHTIEKRIACLPGPGLTTTVGHLTKAVVYAACLRPSVYWIPNSVPGLGLGLTRYAPGFAIERQSPWLAALAATMWPRLREFKSARTAAARRYIEGLRSVDGLAPVSPVPGADPSWLWFPLLVQDEALRARLLSELQGAGIGATGSYPGSLADIPELREVFASVPDADAGRKVARRILTLPTHPYVSARDLERALDTLRRVVGERA